MAKKVKVEDLSKELVKTLQIFANTTDEVVANAIKETSKEALEKLKKANPPGSGEYGPWKEYNKSWQITTTKTDRRYHRAATIHNKYFFWLTHLLEKGHALPQGGRSDKFPHIAPVAKEVEETLLNKIQKGIKNA